MLIYDYLEFVEVVDVLVIVFDKYEDLRCLVIEKLQG